MRKLLVLSLLLVAMCVSGTVQAATFPGKPIQLVVPYAPGGGSDITARIFAEALKDILPQPVVVSNLTGATGLTAAAHVLGSRPDGHTLLWEHPSLTMTGLVANAPFRWSDFDVLCAAANSDNMLVVSKDSPLNSLQDALDTIKANPGKIRFTCAVNTPSHVLCLAIAEKAGANVLVMPVTGDKPRIVSLLGKNSDITTVGLSAATPYLQSGDIKILAAVTNQRSPLFPDVPTLREQGISASFDFLFSVLIPKNVPEETKAILQDAFKKAGENPETQKALGVASTRAFFLDSAQATAWWQEQYDTFSAAAAKNKMLPSK